MIDNRETPQETETEVGASMVEYALLIALISIFLLAAVTSMGKKVSSHFSQTESSL